MGSHIAGPVQAGRPSAALACTSRCMTSGARQHAGQTLHAACPHSCVGALLQVACLLLHDWLPWHVSISCSLAGSPLASISIHVSSSIACQALPIAACRWLLYSAASMLRREHVRGPQPFSRADLSTRLPSARWDWCSLSRAFHNPPCAALQQSAQTTVEEGRGWMQACVARPASVDFHCIPSSSPSFVAQANAQGLPADDFVILLQALAVDIIYLCPTLPSSVLKVASQVCITKLYPLPTALRLMEVVAERSSVCQPQSMAAFLLTLLAGRARQVPLRCCGTWRRQEAVARGAAWLLLQQGPLAGGHTWPLLSCSAVGTISLVTCVGLLFHRYILLHLSAG